MKISIIVPFYKGNKYLDRLFKSIENVCSKSDSSIEWEIIIVNDSPDESVILPDSLLNVIVIENKKNLGIQGTRINGLKNASGNWILFLDQDDELIADGFNKQIELTENADVVVGNGIYKLGKYNRYIFSNLLAMEYLICENRFLKIRNLIPSPGECIIRKSKIPEIWKESTMNQNGADDWLLWILLFRQNAIFRCNEKMVYVHNDTDGANLSADYNKMRVSSKEMVEILRKNTVLTDSELRKLSNAIDFKYYQDTKQLTIKRLIRYAGNIFDNIIYKLTLYYYSSTEKEKK